MFSAVGASSSVGASLSGSTSFQPIEAAYAAMSSLYVMFLIRSECGGGFSFGNLFY